MENNHGPEAIIERLAERLIRVRGVKAVVLGGSRARGTHHPGSDIDIGIYYDGEAGPDGAELNRLAAEWDDSGRTGLVTEVGEWGPWINGGGWLQVDGIPVDLLLRDLSKVEQVVEDGLNGRVTIDYQPGHPHGFVNTIYMAEIACCRVLQDPEGRIAALKARTDPYPEALREGTVRKFLWEASFAQANALKSVGKNDPAYLAGCCFRAVACLNQALFALNGRYLMNEKGATIEADGLKIAIPGYRDAVARLFASLSSGEAEILRALGELERLVQEAERLVGAP
ncbi:nucleotidyltransferase domain-containing protein [Cohnella zeiphila]|uniref:Nucleotidyltransferase domain-containing protein n=1 Tax=Cohnella zeiphila TaxID=2761120 RepID=A0A7X0SPB0_9BACL|nr:nucleotidyltransferase domain-containing protein [Cohnella zeiphila]MBB6732390.1 nucleotidyltransferase domain-containing protein [Cohnella zeiphila]